MPRKAFPATGQGYGWQEEFYVTMESAFGASNPAVPAATNFLPVLRTDAGFTQARIDRIDKNGRRVIEERVTGRKDATFEVERYLTPSGAAKTKPEDNPLWLSLFGTADITNINATVGATSYSVAQYTQVSDFAKSMVLYRFAGNFSEALNGAVVQEVVINLANAEPARVTFRGVAKDHIHTGTSVAKGRYAATASSVATLRLAHPFGHRFSAGSRVRVKHTTAFGEKSSRISAVSHVNATNDRITFPTVLTHAGRKLSLASILSIWPEQPVAPATVDSPASPTQGSIQFDPNDTGTMVTAYITDGTVTINNGKTLRNDEYGRDVASGERVTGRWAVTFDVGCYLQREYLEYLGTAKRFDATDVKLVIGPAGTAGKFFIVDMHRCELNLPMSPAIPETDEVTLRITGVGLGTAAGTGDDSAYVSFA